MSHATWIPSAWINRSAGAFRFDTPDPDGFRIDDAHLPQTDLKRARQRTGSSGQRSHPISEGKAMPETTRYYDAPRLQVVLSPRENDKVATLLVLHFPDSPEPSVMPLTEPLDADTAVERMLAVYAAIRDQFAAQESAPQAAG